MITRNLVKGKTIGTENNLVIPGVCGYETDYMKYNRIRVEKPNY